MGFNGMKQSLSLDRRGNASQSMPSIKWSTTWSKFKFKLNHKYDDDDPLSDSNKKKLKKQRKLKKHNSKKWMKNKQKNNKNNGHSVLNLSDSNESGNKLKDRGKANSHEAVPNGSCDSSEADVLLKDRKQNGQQNIVVAISPSPEKISNGRMKIISFNDISPDDMGATFKRNGCRNSEMQPLKST